MLLLPDSIAYMLLSNLKYYEMRISMLRLCSAKYIHNLKILVKHRTREPIKNK